MKLKRYDTFIIGHISLDEIVYRGVTEKLIGGAVVHSSYAAVAGGNKTGVLTKVSSDDMALLNIFNVEKEDIYCTVSKKTTSIRNEYLSDDREKRICTSLSIADSFTYSDIPKIETRIFHLAGLIAGEFQEDLIEILAGKSMVAVDVQGFLRNSENGNMVFKDWKNKAKYLPLISFLKTDAAEAEVMTGYSDRMEAAKAIFNLGAKEVMITHNTEVLIYDGETFYTQPFKPRNLSGRTGRGDTCFSAYITERLKKAIPDSLLYAAALTSLKMETPGPFKGSRESVEDYIKEYYIV